MGPRTLLVALLLLAPTVVAEEAEPEVAFAAALERSGRDVILRVSLENKGPAAAWVHDFLDFEDYDCAAQARASVQVTLTDARQRVLRTSCKPIVASPVKSPYRVLARGERLTASLALSSCYDFVKGETIDVVAFHEDPNPNAPPPPAGARPFRKRLRAGVLQLVAP